MSDVAGDIARAMVHAPSTAVGAALRDAAVKSSQRSAKAASEAAQANPVAALFGACTFRLPDREGVYVNEKTKAVSRRMAFVSMPIGSSGLTFETSIYAAENVVKDASGSYLEQTFSVSLPRQITASKEEPITQAHLNAWKQDVLNGYEVWAATIDKSTPIRKAQTGPRLVKRVALDSATQ